MSGLIGYRDQVAPAPSKGRGPLRDIRKFIAQSQTKQMDANEFPAYEYRRYPLMPLTQAGKPHFDAAGRAIVLRNPPDEEAFYEEFPDAQRVQDPMDVQDELTALRAEVARLKGKDAEGGQKDPDTKPKIEEKGDTIAKGGVASLRQPAKTDKPAAGPKPGSKLE